jgi:hypothetical protein
MNGKIKMKQKIDDRQAFAILMFIIIMVTIGSIIIMDDSHIQDCNNMKIKGYDTKIQNNECFVNVDNEWVKYVSESSDTIPLLIIT